MEPNRNDSSKNNNNPDSKKPRGRVFTMLLIAVAVVLLVTGIYNSINASKYELKTFSEFLTEMEAGNLSEVEIHSDRIYYMTKEEAEKPSNERRACYTVCPPVTIWVCWSGCMKWVSMAARRSWRIIPSL